MLSTKELFELKIIIIIIIIISFHHMKNTWEKSLGQITVNRVLQSHDLDEIGRNNKINGVDNFALLGDLIKLRTKFIFCFTAPNTQK